MEASRWPAVVMMILVLVTAGYAGKGWIADRLVKPDDGAVKVYGPIVTDSEAYRKNFQGRAWLRNMPIGRSTFGKLLRSQPRFAMDGDGPMSKRRIILETPRASILYEGSSRKR